MNIFQQIQYQRGSLCHTNSVNKYGCERMSIL